jgi:hypothetical protein
MFGKRKTVAKIDLVGRPMPEPPVYARGVSLTQHPFTMPYDMPSREEALARVRVFRDYPRGAPTPGDFELWAMVAACAVLLAGESDA